MTDLLRLYWVARARLRLAELLAEDAEEEIDHAE